MTTYIPFTPSQISAPPFSTQVTLDGTSYTLSCFWNSYRGGTSGQSGWYYQLTDQSGNVVITAALVGSPDNAPIYLAWGILTSSTLLYRTSSGNFETVP
jgi:hypothetical protein